MIGGWWRARRERRVLQRRPIPAPLWQSTLDGHPFLQRLSPADRDKLAALSALFLAEKEFSGAGGLRVTDAMAVAIAAQACLPVLHLGLQPYRRFVGIVVHPDEVVAQRARTDEIGIVHEYDETLVGEAMDGGPVMLSWRDVADAGRLAADGYNVVIHEFIHVLDMADGEANGVPPLPPTIPRHHWRQVLEAGFHRLCRDLEAGRATFLDPYGATAIEEFFPVAAEAFFVAPEGLRDSQPALYDLFCAYFRQDPGSAAAADD